MNTDDLLKLIAERGLTIHVGPDGQPYLRGKREDATEPLLKAVKRDREALLRRLGHKPTRRIVKAEAGEETVVLEWQAGGDYDRLAEQRKKHPGAVLKMQALHTEGYERWETFATVEPTTPEQQS